MFAGGTERCTDPTAMAEGLRIADIVKVVKGVHTDVMLRAKLVDPSTCISIVTGNECFKAIVHSFPPFQKLCKKSNKKSNKKIE